MANKTNKTKTKQSCRQADCLRVTFFAFSILLDDLFGIDFYLF